MEPAEGEGDGEMEGLGVHDGDRLMVGVAEGVGSVRLTKDHVAFAEGGPGVFINMRSAVVPLKPQPPDPDMVVPEVMK